MSRPDLAVVGGGLLGRSLAWRAARQARELPSTMRPAAKEKTPPLGPQPE